MDNFLHCGSQLSPESDTSLFNLQEVIYNSF